MVKLLDCTLRDGGYINNWEFGTNEIMEIIHYLEKTKVDILELGFLKNEKYDSNRTVFSQIDQVLKLIPRKKNNIQYAVMIEVINPIPLDMIEEKQDNNLDIIRVIVWKSKFNKKGIVEDALQEGYEYCKGIVEKGYKLCIQPARVEQYTDEEFVDMLKLFEKLNPLAIYVVDSWGTQNSEQIMHYIHLADRVLKKNIAIGYHGHNNLMQALGTAIKILQMNVNRDLILDASVYGIGRGAGNLNLELIAKYLNDIQNKHYIIEPMLEIFERYLSAIYTEHPWGYSIPYYLTAVNHCNPNYGEYYGIKKGLFPSQIQSILSNMSPEDKILYSCKKADKFMENIDLSMREE